MGAGIEEIRCRRKKFDLKKLQDPAVRAQVTAQLAALPLPGWAVDVNAHADILQSQIHSVLDATIPLRPDAPRSWYLSDSTWDLRQRKHSLKSRTSNRRKDHRRHTLSLAFDLWNPPAGCCVSHLRYLFRKGIVVYEVIAGAITLATHRLRTLIRREKAQHLASLSATVGTCSPHETMTKLRQMQLGRKKLKTWRAHLPQLVNAAGSRTCDRVDVDQLCDLKGEQWEQVSPKLVP